MDRKMNGRVSTGCVIAVTAVMVVLAALVVPVIVSFNHSGRQADCQSNLKELAMAVWVYCGDYNGTLPSSKLVSHSKEWNKKDFLTFATKVGEPHRIGRKRIYTEMIYEYVKQKDMPACPSDSVDVKDSNASTSYWWKTAVDKAWYGEGCRRPFRKLSDYEDGFKMRTILLYEHRAFHDRSEGLVSGAQINIVYMDSHSCCITIKNATSGDSVNCAANSDGEPMYFNAQRDGKTYHGLPDGVPATFTDPSRHVDLF